MIESPEPERPAEPAPSPAADPFEPGPAQLSGCGKPAVIGCLALLAVFAIGMILLISQSPRLLRFLMRTMETQVEAALPPDLDAADRERLERAFDGAAAALAEGRFDATSTSNLQRLSSLMPARGETLSPEEVAEITRVLEEIGSVSGAARRPGIDGDGRVVMAMAVRGCRPRHSAGRRFVFL